MHMMMNVFDGDDSDVISAFDGVGNECNGLVMVMALHWVWLH